MYSMIESEVLFELIDQQYTDISVLANIMEEEVYTTQDENAISDNVGNVLED